MEINDRTQKYNKKALKRNSRFQLFYYRLGQPQDITISTCIGFNSEQCELPTQQGRVGFLLRKDINEDIAYLKQRYSALIPPGRIAKREYEVEKIQLLNPENDYEITLSIKDTQSLPSHEFLQNLRTEDPVRLFTDLITLADFLKQQNGQSKPTEYYSRILAEEIARDSMPHIGYDTSILTDNRFPLKQGIFKCPTGLETKVPCSYIPDLRQAVLFDPSFYKSIIDAKQNPTIKIKGNSDTLLGFE
ncbi:hypothetical protein J4218_04105 [Candidatus Pacearchaeota archaeon]|nr:hypothetical protein [Candidatus Pacearchaeota archaeon]